jgi:hypothetical protein
VLKQAVTRVDMDSGDDTAVILARSRWSAILTL